MSDRGEEKCHQVLPTNPATQAPDKMALHNLRKPQLRFRILLYFSRKSGLNQREIIFTLSGRTLTTVINDVDDYGNDVDTEEEVWKRRKRSRRRQMT